MVIEQRMPTTKLRIRMNRSYDKFGADVQRDFLEHLAKVAGVLPDEIRQVKFRKSCVIFEGELDREAAKLLLELFEKKNGQELTDQQKEFLEFMKKHDIVDVSTDFTIKVHVITSKKTSPRQIVFVHGWRRDKDSFGEIPKYLEERLNCQSLLYDYPTGVWRSSPSIQFIASNLDNWIRNHVSGSKIAIIGHSMGGLIVRKLIVSQLWRDAPLTDRIKQLTFIASPYDGAVLASLGSIIPTFKKVQLTELGPNSPFIFEINNGCVG